MKQKCDGQSPLQVAIAGKFPDGFEPLIALDDYYQVAESTEDWDGIQDALLHPSTPDFVFEKWLSHDAVWVPKDWCQSSDDEMTSRDYF